MADLTALKKRRAYIKGNMTKMLKYINEVKPTTNIEDVKVRLSNVERYRTEFMAIEDKIIALDNDEDLDEEFEENYYKAVSGLNLVLRKKMEPTTSQNETAADISFNGTCTEVRLPKITIPSFSGEYTEWQSYHDLFCSTIHDNIRLTPSQKLQYLKGTLRGEAAGLLKHLSITDANYIEALQKLRNRYDRKKHTIHQFIKNFIQQPTVTTPNSTNVRRLYDTSDEIIRGLKALGEGAESRDHWLIHILVNKLDEDTNRLWAQTSADYDLPTINQFFDFLSKRIDALESLKGGAVTRSQHLSKPTIKGHVAAEIPNPICSLCPEEQHKLFECSKFKELPVEHRKDLLIKENRCFNCLNNNHNLYFCKSRFRCRQCNRKHHTLVHDSLPMKPVAEVKIHHVQEAEIGATSHSARNEIASSILPTALVRVLDVRNQLQQCRVLLDSGSQCSFITENCAQRLGLKRSYAKLAIAGIGGFMTGYTKGSISLTASPLNKPEPKFQIEALILPKLTAKPSIIQVTKLTDLKNIDLADPHFHKGLEIDIIIGADRFFDLLSEEKITTSNQLILQRTVLGWIVAGRADNRQPTQSMTVIMTNHEERLDYQLRQFWEIESIEIPKNNLSKEEEFCEQLFTETCETDTTGRFKVRLPFKLDPQSLGDSYRAAVQRMYSMERKFTKNTEFENMYKDFMGEYISLSHMKPQRGEDERKTGYYLPHHGVQKESSSTTKLRVVFDGSSKTNTGKSLNDCLAVGPTVQSTLYEILLRFRKFKVAFTADVEKMFRQVLVAKEDTRYQRILWRNSPDIPFTTYELQTVTYGTASATYLATRALNESTVKFAETSKDAVDRIKNSMYVDDLMTGADSVEEAMKLKDEINHILSTSGFMLRKWLTNEREMFSNNRPDDSANILEIEPSSSVNLTSLPTSTKRGILSEACRLFDPLGWLAPVIIKIKIFFQKLWVENLNWDDRLPQQLYTEWLNIRLNLPKIDQIEITRYINTLKEGSIALHGFSDASKYAYAAVVYAEIIKNNGSSEIWLLSSKTKVAPVKQISIPRLELCGATLLVRLLSKIKDGLKMEISKITAWTDSTIVLDWLAAHPTKWNTFVGNRTGEILTTMNRSQWRHIDSQDNPADYASRGVDPDQLQNLRLWWKGPEWLGDQNKWPSKILNTNTTEEIRYQTLNIQVSEPNIIDNLVQRISSYNKIVRILAYVIRFLTVKSKPSVKSTAFPYLTCREFQRSQNLLIKHIQSKHFAIELKLIASNKDISPSSKLIYLRPFIDESGLLRVGGRITNAAMGYNIKHPLILEARDELTKLIVREHHLRYLHAGPTLMMATLRTKYWILGARNLIRKTVRSCVKCVKYEAKTLNQIMGDLPSTRVELIRPFYKVGVDYAGPFPIHLTRGRGQKTYKAYICIFICLSTKAVHIELVSELTSDAYIAALRRFIARRGICKEIISDNGTNFIGARNQLYELFKFLKENANEFSHFLLTDQITFKFIPPSSPHFGGLWEAAVKSAKYHLRRVTDGHILTLEELSTLLVEIESMLNSRPICVLSIDDVDYLTPAHFLIGRATTQLPAEDYGDAKLSTVSRWKLLQQMNQHIWKRWSMEYLTNLQQRHKWHKKVTNVKIDDIVLIKDNNLPPAKWLLGKVVELHPGSDTYVRVVSVKTSTGIAKRPVHKLCLLPVN